MQKYPEGLPCWAPGAADCLEILLTGKEIAIEWGGGQSSKWLIDKVAHLHTIEHDPEWAERIRVWIGDVATNFTLHQHPWTHKNYIECINSIPRGATPTVWLIDGYRRIDCFETVIGRMKSGDVVVLDDALDYAESLAEDGITLHKFSKPHPYAGTPINQKQHAKSRNTVRKNHAMTKDTWMWRVP